MQQCVNCVQTRGGAAVAGANVMVKTYPGGTTATIYSDDGVTEQTNPITTDANGQFAFYAADGRYTLVISKTGYITQQTLTDSVLLLDPDDGEPSISAADVSTQASGTGAISRTVQGELRDAWITPEQFGAVGDGSTNDLAALNNAIAAVPVSGTLKLTGGKTYYYETNGIADVLTISKKMTLDMRGATLKHKVVGGSQNIALRVVSTLDTAVVWTETLATIGVNTFTVTTSYAVGDMVMLALGTDPYDATQPNQRMIARVLANSGTVLTVDKSVLYSINGTGHSVQKITSFADNVRIFGLDIDQSAVSLTPDVTLAIETATNVFIDSYRFRDADVALSFRKGSDNLWIGNMQGNIKGVSLKRAFTTYGSTNCRIENLSAFTDSDAAFIFGESWSRNLSFGLVNYRSAFGSTSTASYALRLAGNCTEVKIDKLSMVSNQNLWLVLTSQGADYRINELVLYNTNIRNCDLSRVHRLVYNAVNYDKTKEIYKTIRIQGATSATDYPLLSGHVKKIWVKASSTTNLTSIFLKNSNAVLGAFVSDLVAGSWVDVTLDACKSGLFQTIQAIVNDPTYPDKSIRITTAAGFSGTIEIRVEYFPNSADGGTVLLPFTLFGATAVDLNQAATDVATLTGLPSKYIVRRVTVHGASTSLAASGATLGVFTAAGGTGTTVVSDATMTSLSAATKFVDRTVAASADYLTASTLYLRCGTAHGSAATCSVLVEIEPVAEWV